MDDKGLKKYRVVFPFVEAGLGHIMPISAVCEAFEAKYGDEVEVVKTYFFSDKNDPNMSFVEGELVREVHIHNKRRGWGALQFFFMGIAGFRLSMSYLFKSRYKRGFAPSLNYLKELDADLVFSTHFSTLYYTCEAKRMGLIRSAAAAYCPDPIIGRQWDSRADFLSVSSERGMKIAKKSGRLCKTQIINVPFLIRREVEQYTLGKQYYRNQLGLKQDNFTILVADGAYGAGKMRQTVLQLLKTQFPVPITIAAVCGKNEQLFDELNKLTAPENITLVPFGYTNKTIMLAAAADLFLGKAGASSLAEPTYFGVPSIVTFCATPIERWICDHYTFIGCTIKQTNIKKAALLAKRLCTDKALYSKLSDATLSQRRSDGAEILADAIYAKLKERVILDV